jgi:nucleotide-binding universal stress UspA family protein
MELTGNKDEKGTIIVPVDYSEYSIQACRYAAKIAKKANANINLFHAFYSPAFDLIELTGGLHTQQQLRADVTEKLIDTETKEMNSFIEKLFEFQEFKDLDKSSVFKDINAGLAKDEIISFAERLKPGMVVMGTRGVDKKSTSILGSITEAAIKRLKVPVMAIPEDYIFLGEENLRKIVYLTDYDESDFVSIKKLMQFSQLFNMSIHCVHIGPRVDKWEKLKMEGFKEYFKNAYKNESIECHILENKPDLLDAIDNYVQENKINVIALTHRKRKLLESVFRPSITKKIFYHTEIPLLVFHS